jgi:uncharacterized membrane protein YhiD involved in acid resistance
VGALGGAAACGAWDIAVLLGVVNLATLRLLRPVKEMIDSTPAERDEL